VPTEDERHDSQGKDEGPIRDRAGDGNRDGDREQTASGTSGPHYDAGVEQPDSYPDADRADRAERVDAADTADAAAASALARAREAARAKGLRPGSRPLRRRNPGESAGSAGSNRNSRGGNDRADGRDPSLLGDQMDRLLSDRGWNIDVAIGSVMGRWPAIVGTEVAAHCTPVTFGDGVLIVRADSTAWATQLRLMSSSILGRLETEVGKGAVTELRVQGPSAPSWTRGPRKSTGPGPRDTYG